MLSCRGGQRSGQLRTRVGVGRLVFLYKQATGLSPLLNQHEALACQGVVEGEAGFAGNHAPLPSSLRCPTVGSHQPRQVVKPCTYRRSLWWREAPLLSAHEEGPCLRREGPHRSQVKATQPVNDRARLDQLPLSWVFNCGASSHLQPGSSSSSHRTQNKEVSQRTLQLPSLAGQNPYSLTRTRPQAIPNRPPIACIQLFPEAATKLIRAGPPCLALHHLLNSGDPPRLRLAKWDPRISEVLGCEGVFLGGGAKVPASSHGPSSPKG